MTIPDITIPEITVPSLRPRLLGAPFPGTDLPTLPAALAEVQVWIDAAEEPVGPGSSRWHAWPDRPDFEPIYGPVSLNTGAAGIAWYSLAAADATEDAAHADRARRAARYIQGAWRDHVEDQPLNLPGLGLGHYGGLAGIATVLVELAGREPQYRSTAVAMLDEILARTGQIGGRADGWTGFNGMLGDGGIVIDLVEAAHRLGEPRYLEAAVAAGQAILAEERSEEHGASWPGVPARAFGLDADI